MLPERRSPDSCPYRRGIRGEGDGESALCGLLGTISGVEDHELLEERRIPRSVCTLCGLEAVPRPERLNPTVASHLIHLLLSVEERGGVPGCDPAKAERLKHRAVGSLQRLSNDKHPWRTPEYSGDCFHLSGKVPTPEGPQAYHCRHELHDVTTTDLCRKCPDYDPCLPRGNAVSNWAVGVITAPRQVPTLPRTLRSLADAGWEAPFVYADYDTQIGLDQVPEERLVRRPVKYQAWGNYICALHELMMIQPDADAYLLAEDDVVFCRGLRAYLEAELWPTPRVGFVSLHTASHQDDHEGTGFFPTYHGAFLWGAQAFVFPNVSARLIVRHPRIVDHRFRGAFSHSNTDVVAGDWAARMDLPVFLHTPSPTQHIGETSAIWGEESTLEGTRVAVSFPGEDADIRAVVEEAKKKAESSERTP